MSEDRRSGERRRTLALHGRNAALTSSLTPQSVAASNPCLNCGTNVQLEYCPECGQRAIDPDPTLREFLHELAEEFLHWDGKLVTTFRALVTKPGMLTVEYLAGKRVRYISPLRLYLACSVLYFFVSALVPQPKLVISKGGAVTTRIGGISIQEPDSTATMAALDTLALHGRWVGRVWGVHYANAMRNRSALPRHIAAAIPKTMFVLLPLFAALVMIVLRMCRRRFPQHLAFALHVHAFLFLVLTLMLVRRVTDIVPIQVGATLIGITAILVYFVQAMRTVYEVSLGAAVARSALVGISYFLAFAVAMVLTFGLIVLLQF
ncbi:MAG: hypothetical protein JWL61_302 [Gemmatimonadetes bacterium]|nr:hypothetical protein [Gemmatimonadota bacterium]